MYLNKNNMSFEEYAKQLTDLRTRDYPMMNKNMVYPGNAIASEGGELADKIKKHWRNKTSELRKNGMSDEDATIYAMSAVSLPEELKLKIIKEMGDVLWYLWALSEELGITLSSVAFENVSKLADRVERNVICSEGDNR